MEFVSFEIAKKLKGKGYPQVKKNTIAMYDENGDWYSLIDTFDYFEYSFEDFKEHGCICPTISQVLKWLRDKKKYVVMICVTYEGNYYWVTRSLEKEIQKLAKDEYISYEQAALAGIEDALDNLIKI